MGMKIEVSGKPVSMLSNKELNLLAEHKGKKAHKARAELSKRKVLS